MLDTLQNKKVQLAFFTSNIKIIPNPNFVEEHLVYIFVFFSGIVTVSIKIF